MKRRDLVLASALMSSGILPLQAKIVSELKVPEIQEIKVHDVSFYPFIELEGSPKDRGRVYGEKAKDAIAQNIDFFM